MAQAPRPPIVVERFVFVNQQIARLLAEQDTALQDVMQDKRIVANKKRVRVFPLQFDPTPEKNKRG